MIYKEAFGYANFETKKLLTVDSMKIFTAVAIMLLKDGGSFVIMACLIVSSELSLINI